MCACVHVGANDDASNHGTKPRLQPGLGMQFRGVGHVRAHIGACSVILHTSDEGMVFSGGVDGSIFAYRRCDTVAEMRIVNSDVQVVRDMQNECVD